MLPEKLIHSCLLLLFSYTCLTAQEGKYFSPADIEIDRTFDRIYVAGKTANEIRIYDLDDHHLIHTVSTRMPPKAIKIAGDHLLITQSYSEGSLLIADRKSMSVKSRIDVGHGACDLTTNSNHSMAFVCNQFSNDISLISLKDRIEVVRIPVLRFPMQIEISKDDKYLYVANFLTAGRADQDTVTSEISIIDIEKKKVIKNIALANGSNALRGMSISADGKYIFVSHNLGRFQVPTTQLEQGWMNTSAMSVIQTSSMEFIATVLLDEPEYGAAGSWGISTGNDFIYVAHSGTHDYSKISYHSFIRKLNDREDKNSLSSDLRFLQGIRERIKVNGNGPRALTCSGEELFVANYFTDNINIFGENSQLLKTIDVTVNGETDITRKGEIYFNDATYCFQGWQSCNGCHPDEARTDGLNWDLLNDGIGNPKNCKSMLLAHETPPAMITGIRPDAETAVRAGFTHIQFTTVSEEHATAVDSYLKSLQPLPSPYLIKGELSSNAQQGKAIFERIGCNHCHSGKWFTDRKIHEMGKPGKYDRQNSWDTPTLIEVWRTAPYLHDGRSPSILDLLVKEQHGLRQELTPREAELLAEYVLSL